jgi:uncharacterized protein YaiE (UPF0345 family)
MADYVEILDTQIEPDAPLTAVLAGQWRDNPIAIAQGSVGAPRANGKMAATLLEYAASNPLTGLSAGDLTLQPALFEGYSFTNVSTQSSTFQSAGTCEIGSRATGTMRFSATQTQTSTLSANRTGEVRLLKNSVEIALFSLTAFNTTVSAVREVDATATVGDVFEWQVRSVDFGTPDTRTASIGSILVRANDTYTTQPLHLKVSEVRP